MLSLLASLRRSLPVDAVLSTQASKPSVFGLYDGEQAHVARLVAGQGRDELT